MCPDHGVVESHARQHRNGQKCRGGQSPPGNAESLLDQRLCRSHARDISREAIASLCVGYYKLNAIPILLQRCPYLFDAIVKAIIPAGVTAMPEGFIQLVS